MILISIEESSREKASFELAASINLLCIHFIRYWVGWFEENKDYIVFGGQVS